MTSNSRNERNGAEFTERRDSLIFGHRLRHYRLQAGLTLEQLGERVAKRSSYLSMLENGRRHPNLGLVDDLATALGVDASDLLLAEAPNRRARLEIDLERAQANPLYRDLELPHVKPTARIPDEVLENLLGLYREVRQRSLIRAATPEEARRANAGLRAQMRERNNYFPEIEQIARQALDAVGYPGSGAVSPRLLTDIADYFGFTVRSVQDVPSSARSITDLRRRRIYIPQRDELRTRVARSVVLQTLGHFALDHTSPGGFGDFLRQRVEANYFAGAILLPEHAAVGFLQDAKQRRDLSVEDLKELFYVSYEMAAHRFTNLATHHLDLPVHFVRSDEQGIIWKAYENNGVPFPADPQGAIEGQRLCRRWGTRQVFGSEDRYSIHYQYTDTAEGTFWCGTYLAADSRPPHAITVGAGFSEARFFRGRETDRRTTSTCPDPDCCRRPPRDLAETWEDFAWPSPRTHSHVLAALPAGTFPGVDLTEVYEFLEDHGT